MEYWHKVQQIFLAAIRQKPEERPIFLDRMCRKNKTLRSEVESLLNSHDTADSFLESPAEFAITVVPDQKTRKLEKGKAIGHFTIIRQIGAGGMGEIYLARDSHLDRNAAIKFLHEEFSRDRGKIKRFKQEAKAAAIPALELDDSLAQPHSVLAQSLQIFDWDRERAETEYRLSIEKSPNIATVHQ